jgi:hypothetical protein
MARKKPNYGTSTLRWWRTKMVCAPEKKMKLLSYQFSTMKTWKSAQGCPRQNWNKIWRGHLVMKDWITTCVEPKEEQSPFERMLFRISVLKKIIFGVDSMTFSLIRISGEILIFFKRLTFMKSSASSTIRLDSLPGLLLLGVAIVLSSKGPWRHLDFGCDRLLFVWSVCFTFCLLVRFLRVVCFELCPAVIHNSKFFWMNYDNTKFANREWRNWFRFRLTVCDCVGWQLQGEKTEFHVEQKTLPNTRMM